VKQSINSVKLKIALSTIKLNLNRFQDFLIISSTNGGILKTSFSIEKKNPISQPYWVSTPG
jgi:hypothetical protein